MLHSVRAEFEQELSRIDTEIDNYQEQLRAFIAIFDETFGNGDRLCPFCMVACAQDEVPDFVREEVLQFWLTGERWVQRQLERGQSMGMVRADVEPAACGKVLVAMLEGAMITARAFGDRSRLDNAGNWFMQELAAR